MPSVQSTPGLLGLPTESRLQIIFEVLNHIDKDPVFEEVIDDRVPMKSWFDSNTTRATNIYVPREDTPAFHGNGLLRTCKQLRAETEDLLQSMRENKVKGVEFVLDVMFVKGLGLLPTWLRVPFRPQHIETLRIQLRIVRPRVGLIPADWVDRAQYADEAQAHENVDGNLAAVLLPYAFRRLVFIPQMHSPGSGEYNVAIENAKDMYTADQLLIDLHPLQVVSDGEEYDCWYSGTKVPQGFDRPGSKPFGYGVYLGAIDRSTAQRAESLAYLDTPRFASFELGERVKEILKDIVDDARLLADLSLNAETLLTNTNSVNIRAVDSQYTELEDLASKIDLIKKRANGTA